MIPTNESLYKNAPDTVKESVKNWIRHHIHGQYDNVWVDWAAKNLLADPEFRGAFKKEFGFDYPGK